MRSEEKKTPKSEWFSTDSDKGVRILAYTYAISGKEGSVAPSEGGSTKGSSGIAGLMNELEKTKLDV